MPRDFYISKGDAQKHGHARASGAAGRTMTAAVALRKIPATSVRAASGRAREAAAYRANVGLD